MPRQGQKAMKRQYDESTDKSETVGSQALPVADLPDDWIGVPEDGATYLALASRANSRLPFVTRAPIASAVPGVGEAGPSTTTSAAPPTPLASTSRHPALPTETWLANFTSHFTTYRQSLAPRWPPSSEDCLPSSGSGSAQPPIPDVKARSAWYTYVHGSAGQRAAASGAEGVDRKGSRVRQAAKRRAAKAQAASAATGAMDEEEMMNAPLVRAVSPVDSASSFGSLEDMAYMEQSEEEEEEEEEALEAEELLPLAGESPPLPLNPTSNEEGSKAFSSPEPLVSSLRTLRTYDILRIISHMTHFIDERLTLPHIPSFIPTNDAPSSQGNAYAKDPLSPLYTRWIFALLLVLDAQLSGEEISVIRELARVAMKVAAWRWVVAVQSGQVTSLAIAEEPAEGGWALGQCWHEADELQVDGRGDSDSRLDDVLGRCWLIVAAVSAGWAQRDLLQEMNTLFS